MSAERAFLARRGTPRKISERFSGIQLAYNQVFDAAGRLKHRVDRVGQVSIRKLKEIHSATHPSAKLERRPPQAADDARAEQPDHAVAFAEELLADLDARAEAEDADEASGK